MRAKLRCAKCKAPLSDCDSCSGEAPKKTFCSKGCDCYEAREHEKQHIESKLEMKFEEPFFINKGITIVPTGYEGPYVFINERSYQKEDLLVLQNAIFRAIKWCDEGWCPGLC